MLHVAYRQLSVSEGGAELRLTRGRGAHRGELRFHGCCAIVYAAHLGSYTGTRRNASSTSIRHEAQCTPPTHRLVRQVSQSTSQGTNRLLESRVHACHLLASNLWAPTMCRENSIFWLFGIGDISPIQASQCEVHTATLALQWCAGCSLLPTSVASGRGRARPRTAAQTSQHTVLALCDCEALGTKVLYVVPFTHVS